MAQAHDALEWLIFMTGTRGVALAPRTSQKARWTPRPLRRRHRTVARQLFAVLARGPEGEVVAQKLHERRVLVALLVKRVELGDRIAARYTEDTTAASPRPNAGTANPRARSLFNNWLATACGRRRRRRYSYRSSGRTTPPATGTHVLNTHMGTTHAA